ncbi:hypothetical protein ACFLKC_13965 [Clostridium caseinilyticum]|uniref:hypothetical protein n=1 Tax=Clostridium caseinilyticum TaxID=3350403 RepID=UPI0038F664D3
MFYYKITNFRDQFGQYDYKNLDMTKIVAGSQIYFDDLIVLANTEKLETTKDLEEIIEEEYLNYKQQYENDINNKKENLEEKIKLLTENLAQEKISNMKKDTLAINLTKEIANLKLEIMNLKKGGNE